MKKSISQKSLFLFLVYFCSKVNECLVIIKKIEENSIFIKGYVGVNYMNRSYELFVTKEIFKWLQYEKYFICSRYNIFDTRFATLEYHLRKKPIKPSLKLILTNPCCN